MVKYIVELKELPNNCYDCPLINYNDIGEDWCGITEKEVTGKCREKDCPIKIID